MYLIPIPAFADNCLWLVHNGKRALVVHPGEAAPALRVVKEHRLQLDAILVTHHHADHTGDVDALRNACGAVVPEGTPARMGATLDTLAALPGSTVPPGGTMSYCPPAYTVGNPRIAMAVKPGNTDLATYRAYSMHLHEDSQPTLPASIA